MMRSQVDMVIPLRGSSARWDARERISCLAAANWRFPGLITQLSDRGSTSIRCLALIDLSAAGGPDEVARWHGDTLPW